MTTEEIKKKIEEMYPLSDPRKEMHHDNMGQYSRRDAALKGYRLAQQRITDLEKEVGRLKKIIWTMFDGEDYPDSKEQFKLENNL